MKFKRKLLKIFTILTLGLGAINISILGVNQAVNPKYAHFIPKCENLRNHGLFNPADCISSEKTQLSEPKDYLLNIIFNPIFSFPIIFVFLFLIWRKLKVNNSLK